MKSLKLNSPDVIADDTGDDLVLINLRTGLYYRFANDSRALLLQHANLDSSDESNGKNDEGIVDCTENELNDFLGSLQERGLVVSCNEIIETDNAQNSRDINMLKVELQYEEYGDLEDLLGLDPIHDIDPEKGWPAIN